MTQPSSPVGNAPLSVQSEEGELASEVVQSSVSSVPAERGRRRGDAASRSRLGVDERRAQLLELGQELFGIHSYEELSIDEIARAAGISKGLLYHYFPSKRDYYVEVIRACATELLALTNGRDTKSPYERLTAGLDGYLDFVQDHEKPFASLMRNGIGFDPEVCRIVEETRQAFLARFLDALPDPLTPRLRNALRGWIGYVEGAVLDWLDNRDISRDELRTLLLEVAVRNLMLVRSKSDPIESEVHGIGDQSPGAAGGVADAG
jgi:AcrR family transcriptional regulator